MFMEKPDLWGMWAIFETMSQYAIELLSDSEMLEQFKRLTHMNKQKIISIYIMFKFQCMNTCKKSF